MMSPNTIDTYFSFKKLDWGRADLVMALDRIVLKDANRVHRVKSVEFASERINANQG